MEARLDLRNGAGAGAEWFATFSKYIDSAGAVVTKSPPAGRHSGAGENQGPSDQRVRRLHRHAHQGC